MTLSDVIQLRQIYWLPVTTEKINRIRYGTGKCTVARWEGEALLNEKPLQFDICDNRL